MDQQEPSGKRPKATRIEDESVAFNRVVPIVLIALAVITVGLIVAALLVVLGVF